VGDRHDSDQPGPVDWFGQDPRASDRTWRWVYGLPVAFQPAPVAPPPPGGTAAAQLNREIKAGHTALPILTLPGDTITTGKATHNHLPTISDILLGKSRRRH